MHRNGAGRHRADGIGDFADSQVIEHLGSVASFAHFQVGLSQEQRSDAVAQNSVVVNEHNAGHNEGRTCFCRTGVGLQSRMSSDEGKTGFCIYTNQEGFSAFFKSTYTAFARRFIVEFAKACTSGTLTIM